MNTRDSLDTERVTRLHSPARVQGTADYPGTASRVSPDDRGTSGGGPKIEFLCSVPLTGCGEGLRPVRNPAGLCPDTGPACRSQGSRTST